MKQIYDLGWVCGFDWKGSYKTVRFNEPLKKKQTDVLRREQERKNRAKAIDYEFSTDICFEYLYRNHATCTAEQSCFWPQELALLTDLDREEDRRKLGQIQNKSEESEAEAQKSEESEWGTKVRQREEKGTYTCPEPMAQRTS